MNKEYYKDYHGPFLIDDKAFETVLMGWRMQEVRTKVIEGNALQDGNIIDSIFFSANEKDELEEWIQEIKKKVFQNPDAITEIFLIEHDHSIDSTNIYCDCAEQVEQPVKPYWSSELKGIIW